MEATQGRTGRREVAKEHTQTCSCCSATIEPVDQFYSDEGVVCPACHLQVDAVVVDHSTVPSSMLSLGAAAVTPLLVSWMSAGAVGAWLEGGVMMRSGAITMLFVAAVLGTIGLAMFTIGSRAVRDAVVGRYGYVEGGRARVFNGLSGGWMTLHGGAAFVMMAWLAWAVLMG